jgi:hypothetical protein
MAKKNNKWFGPAKATQAGGGFGVYSWKGWVSVLVFIILVLIDIVTLSKDVLLAIIIAIVLTTGFLAIAIKHGAKFGNNNFSN